MFLPLFPVSSHFNPVTLNSFPNKLNYYFYYRRKNNTTFVNVPTLVAELMLRILSISASLPRELDSVDPQICSLLLLCGVIWCRLRGGLRKAKLPRQAEL
jgi:hypothetical protein